MKKKYSILILFSILIGGCYYDVEEELYPPGSSGPCDATTTTVTYSGTVRTILQNYACLSCHSVAPSGNIRLDTYTGVKANSARMLGSITHSPGFQPMPQGGNKMSDCDIAKVKAWIDTGMPNN